MITVTLPWPAPPLWVNRKAHWARRSPAATAARNAAYTLTLAACGGAGGAAAVRESLKGGEQIAVSWMFYPPDRRSYDIQGVYSACKASEDGIADALGVNDRRFRPVVLEDGPLVKGGQVVVILGIAPASAGALESE